jgi:WD40 repeat protein
VKIWDLNIYECLDTLVGHEGPVSCLQFDASRIVSGSYDKTVRIWDLRSGQCMHCLEGHYLWVGALQYDAVRVVSGSGDGTIRLWDKGVVEMHLLAP